MKKLIALLAAFLVAHPASPQFNPPSPITAVTSAPAGSCTANQGRLVGPGGVLYTCQSGTWRVATGSSAPGTAPYAAGGGTAQAQTATYSPAITLTTGQQACWLPLAANTAAGPTFAPNGLTAHTIVKAGGISLVANDLTTTAVACAVYDATGTRWELQNPQTGVIGTSLNFQGAPLTGASFQRACLGTGTGCTSNASTGDLDIFTCPTGKRCLVMGGGGYNNNAGTVNWYPELKSGSSYYRLTTSVASGASGATTFAIVGIILDPAELLSVNVSATGLDLVFGILQFDNSSALRSVKVLGTASGANALYTVPANKSAFVANAAGNAWNVTSAVNFASGSVAAGLSTISLTPSGGSSNLLGNFSWAANTRTVTLITGGLTLSTGDSLSISPGTNDAAQIAWVNVVEISN